MPSKAGKKKIYFVFIISVPIPSYGQLHIVRHQLKKIKFVTTKVISVMANKNLAADITPHIYSSLRYVYVIFERSILPISAKVFDTFRAGTLGS